MDVKFGVMVRKQEGDDFLTVYQCSTRDEALFVQNLLATVLGYLNAESEVAVVDYPGSKIKHLQGE